MSNTRTYISWQHMKDRCLNEKHKSYYRYGGRGIKICDRWLGESGFENFLKDMRERPSNMSLDRFPDKNGNYEPKNCRWATQEQQSQNTNSNKLNNEIAKEIRLRAKTENLTHRELAEAYGVVHSTITFVINNKIWKQR